MAKNILTPERINELAADAEYLARRDQAAYDIENYPTMRRRLAADIADYQDTAKALRTLAKIQEAHEKWSNTSDEYANREFAWQVSDILCDKEMYD